MMLLLSQTWSKQGCGNLCSVGIYAVLGFMQCWDLCSIGIYAVLGSMQCWDLCSVGIYAVLESMQCWDLCSVGIYALLGINYEIKSINKLNTKLNKTNLVALLRQTTRDTNIWASCEKDLDTVPPTFTSKVMTCIALSRTEFKYVILKYAIEHCKSFTLNFQCLCTPGPFHTHTTKLVLHASPCTSSEVGVKKSWCRL